MRALLALQRIGPPVTVGVVPCVARVAGDEPELRLPRVVHVVAVGVQAVAAGDHHGRLRVLERPRDRCLARHPHGHLHQSGRCRRRFGNQRPAREPLEPGSGAVAERDRRPIGKAGAVNGDGGAAVDRGSLRLEPHKRDGLGGVLVRERHLRDCLGAVRVGDDDRRRSRDVRRRHRDRQRVPPPVAAASSRPMRTVAAGVNPLPVMINWVPPAMLPKRGA